MGAQWEQALDALLDLYLFAKSDRGRYYITGWADAETNDRDDMTFQRDLSRLDERIAATAWLADPVWVDPDMMTLWEAASETFQMEPLVEQDLLCENGFVYLPRPMNFRDRHGRTTALRAFSWTRNDVRIRHRDGVLTLPAVTLMAFHQLGDHDDYDTGKGLVDKDGQGHIAYAPMRRGDLIIDHLTVWPFGTAHGKRTTLRAANGDDVVWNESHADPEVFRWSLERPVQCLWRLMQQTVATHGEMVASRAFRRRWERERLEPRRITVIRLRRPKADDGHEPEHRDVEWASRWVVRGHWRNQWYPSLQTHRQVYIHPFVKGPEDKPLVVRKARVFELVR